MLTTVKKLSRLSLVYIAGDIITKGIAFLLLPLYTRFLTPEDYGIMAVTSMVGSVLGMLLSFGMWGAILRFYYMFTEVRERQYFFGAMWVFLMAVPGVITLVLSQLGRPLFTILFYQVPFDPYIRLTLWSAFLHTAFALIPPTLFRAREQAVNYLAFSLLNFTMTTSFTVWFVVFQGRGAVGAVAAQFMSALVMAVVASVILIKEVSPNFRWRQLGPAIAYSGPLVPHFLSHWALNVSDRAILERNVSLSQLGIYSLGYQFGLVLQMVGASVNNALMPMFSRAANDKKEFELVGRVATYYILMLAIVALAIALLAQDIIILVTPPTYHSAGAIVPWIALGYFMMGFYYLPMNTLSMTVGKTRAVPFITMTSAATNIGLNLFLVPRFGILAAAVNTFVGYTALAILMFILAQRTRPLVYEYERLAKIFLMALLLFAFGSLLMQFSPWVNLLLGAGTVLLFPLALTVLNFWTKKEEEHFARLRQRFVHSAGKL